MYIYVLFLLDHIFLTSPKPPGFRTRTFPQPFQVFIGPHAAGPDGPGPPSVRGYAGMYPDPNVGPLLGNPYMGVS